MRGPLEMVTASFMQNMVQIREIYFYFMTNFVLLEFLEKVFLGLSALRAPTVGPFYIVYLCKVTYDVTSSYRRE